MLIEIHVYRPSVLFYRSITSHGVTETIPGESLLYRPLMLLATAYEYTAISSSWGRDDQVGNRADRVSESRAAPVERH